MEWLSGSDAGVILIAVILAILLARSVVVVRENERIALFRLGRLAGVLGPGLHWGLPGVDRVVRVNLDEALPGWRALSEEQIARLVEARVMERAGGGAPGGSP
ncbi:MAG: SPFH domain-containing protein [Acidobacteriota bacterium]